MADADPLKTIALSELLAELNPTVLVCDLHPEYLADGACVDCGAALCRLCAVEALPHLRCADCRELHRRKRRCHLGLKALRLPALWVVLCVLVTAVLNFCGVGNPSEEQLRRSDSGEKWYRQQLPRLYLGKAAREKVRAALLFEFEREAEAKKWSRWSAGNYFRAAELWRDTPVAPDLELAGAVALLRSGDVRAALDRLRAIDDTLLRESNPGVIPYRIAQAHEALGEPDRAREAYFRAIDELPDIMKLLRKPPISDKVTEFSQSEMNAIAGIEGACANFVSPAVILEDARKAGVRPPGAEEEEKSRAEWEARLRQYREEEQRRREELKRYVPQVEVARPAAETERK